MQEKNYWSVKCVEGTHKKGIPGRRFIGRRNINFDKQRFARTRKYKGRRVG